MLQDLGLGGGGGGGGGEDEAGNLFPLMQTMLENILCKEILYPPIKEIVDKVSVVGLHWVVSFGDSDFVILSSDFGDTK